MSKAQTFGFFSRLFARRNQPGPGSGLDGLLPMRKFDRGALSGDSAEAIEHFKQEAEKGDAAAQNSFGLRFVSGEGVPRSDEEASKWFRRAAQQGLAEAQFNLGKIFYTASLRHLAMGIGEDRMEAYMWFHLAAAQGHLRAEAFEETLNLQLTDAELNEGNRRADAFEAWREMPGNARSELS